MACRAYKIVKWQPKNKQFKGESKGGGRGLGQARVGVEVEQGSPDPNLDSGGPGDRGNRMTRWQKFRANLTARSNRGASVTAAIKSLWCQLLTNRT